jgi:hypothetical protein
LPDLLFEELGGFRRVCEGGRPSSLRTRGFPSDVGPDLGFGGAEAGLVGGGSPLLLRLRKCWIPIWMKFVVVQYSTSPAGKLTPITPKMAGIM